MLFSFTIRFGPYLTGTRHTRRVIDLELRLRRVLKAVRFGATGSICAGDNANLQWTAGVQVHIPLRKGNGNAGLFKLLVDSPV